MDANASAEASAGPASILEDMQSVATSPAAPATSTAAEPQARAEPSPEVATPAGDRPRGPDGKFIPKGATTEGVPEGAASGTPTPKAPEAKPAAASPEGTSPAKPPAPEGGGAAPHARAPQSWKPSEREAWEKIPEPARQAIVRREREAAAALQAGAEHRKVAETWRQAVAPHEARLKAQGRDAAKDIGGMLAFDALLDGPHVGAKAQAVATILHRAGLTSEDGLKALAAALDSGAPAPTHQAPLHDPRLDALLAQLEEAKATREAQETQAFGEKHEFYPDVSDAMQKIMQAGLANTREEAYNAACWANPEVRTILQQREVAATAKAQQASTQSALAAASSIRSEPTSAVGTPGGSDDIRADLMAEASRKRR